MAIGLTCSRFFFQVQTSQQAIVDYGTEYMTIVCGLSVGLFVQITFDRVLQATGRTFYTMITQAVGAIINIIMDPILIFGLFGFPRMEVAGAALATVLGQILAACLSIFFNLTRNHDIQFQFRGFRPDGRIIPSIIMQSIGSVMVFGMNKILISFTTTATAVFGVYFKLQSFIFMPVFGLNNGMVPIVAFNYGARRPDRIMKTIKLSITYAVCIMLVGLLIFQFAPDVMLVPGGGGQRRHAHHRRARPADHLPELPLCRLRHCVLLRVPGPGPRGAEPHGVRGAAAGGPPAGGLPALPHRKPGTGVVGFPHRGAVLPDPVHRLPAPGVPA